MGREANCYCQWGLETGQCKALLETTELIVRSPVLRRVPIASLTDVSVRGEALRFRAGGDDVVLQLGASLAQSWAKKIATPPPTLAAKLGITRDSRLMLLGEFETVELKSVVEAAGASDGMDANLWLARTRTKDDLNFILDRYSAQGSQPAIWIIYSKGMGRLLSESVIRETLRHEGFIDTKIASVSSDLTALKFIRRH